MTSISASTVYNASGSRPLLIVCEHASNFVPENFQQLGLTLEELSRHIAFDPGALDVAKGLAEAIDAPLVHSNISRLVIDLNRSPDDFDSIPKIGELTPVPSNIGLNQRDRDMRVHAYYHPFHSAVSDLIFKRRDLRAIVSVHSFTPVFKSRRRPWHLGIIHDEDVAFPMAILNCIRSEADICCDLNVPYSPDDRVYHTLARHKRDRHSDTVLQTAMIELRNDLINEPNGREIWIGRLARAITAALQSSS